MSHSVGDGQGALQFLGDIGPRHIEFFREFLVQTPKPAADIARALAKKGIVPGLPVSRYFPDKPNELLVCVTEMNSRPQIERLAIALKEASK